MSLPRVAITVGDPAGIGPEIAAMAAADPRVRRGVRAGGHGPAARRARGHGSGLCRRGPGRLRHDRRRRGRRSERGEVDAIATAPVSKEAFALAGLPWKGHTDLLGHLTGSPFVAMMFESPALRVVLATVHVALRDVPALLTQRPARTHHRADRRRAAAIWRRRAAPGGRGAEPPRRRARADGRGRRSRCWRRRWPPHAPQASTWPGRFRPTPCSCGRIAASSTP